MRKRVVLCFAATLMVVGVAMTSGVARAADDPMSGTWKVNLGKSKFDPGPAPKSLTATIKVENDTETFMSEGVDAAGNATHAMFAAKFGGPDAPVTGIPYADMVSVKRVKPNHIVATMKKGGKVTMIVHMVVAEDGKSRRLTYEGKNQDGKAVHDEVVYDRVSWFACSAEDLTGDGGENIHVRPFCFYGYGCSVASGEGMANYPEKISAGQLELSICAEAGAAIVKCVGRLTSENAAALKGQVRSMIPNEKRIVLDLTDLVGMDSSGLGAIVSLYVSERNAKCELQLVNLSQKVRDLLGLSNLLGVFGDCGKYGVGRM
jgi:anti-sigma B factor antagonist